ncbi:hypothetical protein AKJ58_00490 [candidate division MSBL1 archaeon SCGC-AAA385D11]|uniref:Uncharacterized protein n=1 Tax=candidate division MSBL1 archaeon SCGC-AAA385D11 TaxID=1698286 RepID=A0A133VPA4_9EURY|nr:hypothetical protein AKJ58_00490 [candidate division MSBL1 archaeon SCGC-AAA385D11]
MRIITPSIVRAELEELSEYPDPEGKAAKKALELISEGLIITEEVEAEKEAQELLSPHVDEGEASCFICCRERGTRNLIMDDVNAATELEEKALRSGIRQKISVAIITELMKKGEISSEKARLAVNKLVKTRDWRGGVLEALVKKYFLK